MQHSSVSEIDYGVGKKKLSVYLLGFLLCVILTLIPFFIVIKGSLPIKPTLLIIYSAALLQFLVQVVCFLRLNTQTESSKTNLMLFVFFIFILLVIVLGSLWIMWNLNYNMMH